MTSMPNNFSIKRDIKKRIRQTLENVFQNILTVKADYNVAHTVYISCEKNGTVRNLLEQGRYYGTNTCDKDMNLIIMDAVSDEYNYNKPRVAQRRQKHASVSY